MFQIVYMLVWTIYAIVTMTFETAIGIILAALAVLLTGLAIMIGIAAIWGWGGIKEAAAKAASDAMQETLRKYPDPSVMQDLLDRLGGVLGAWEALRDQIVTDSPKTVAPASKEGVQKEAVVPPPYPK